MKLTNRVLAFYIVLLYLALGYPTLSLGVGLTTLQQDKTAVHPGNPTNQPATAVSEANQAQPYSSTKAKAIAEKEATLGSQADPLVGYLTSHWTGDLDGMLKDRAIRALVVQSRTMYFIDRAKRHGIAYELLTTFEQDVNKRFPPKQQHLKTHVAFVPVSRDQLIPALLDGRGDIAVADITITAKRQEKIDFSDPFFTDINEIVVTGPSSPELGSLDDLSGQEVFVRRSSSYWEHMEDINRQFADEEKAPIHLRPAPEQLEDVDLMEMVNAGLVGIIVVDDYNAQLWAEVLPNIKLHPEIQIHTGGEFAWMMRKDSPKLKEVVNAFAKTHGQGTAFGNTMVRRYVDSSKFVKQATTSQALKKFRQVVDLFQRYAEQYDVEHLLMIAKGYQESRLDQQAKSPVGAIGIMQIMPATGKDLDVGDIRQLEPNIHAGIKYHRFIIDQYFKDEPVDALNKTLFAFAAYNAGPGRLRGLRRAAEERGLDPNLWFDNVELLAAEKIGAETVTYVANIFKYYVAYKLIEEHNRGRQEVKDAIEGATDTQP